jgi:hypothetical protein
MLSVPPTNHPGSLVACRCTGFVMSAAVIPILQSTSNQCSPMFPKVSVRSRTTLLSESSMCAPNGGIPSSTVVTCGLTREVTASHAVGQLCVATMVCVLGQTVRNTTPFQYLVTAVGAGISKAGGQKKRTMHGTGHLARNAASPASPRAGRWGPYVPQGFWTTMDRRQSERQPAGRTDRQADRQTQAAGLPSVTPACKQGPYRRGARCRPSSSAPSARG